MSEDTHSNCDKDPSVAAADADVAIAIASLEAEEDVVVAVPKSSSSLELILGCELVEEIHHCRILLVGAGGIGCELVKNLVLSGFHKVRIVDLDTIDVSNLNRQLLFRSHHVGQPKCTTAAQVAHQMMMMSTTTTRTSTSENGVDGGVQYEALHANVCDTNTFHKPFVQQFDLVLNALDNLTARRRVNRLCLAAHVPLIEAGTTGYLGQTNVISAASGSSNDDDEDAATACYECQSVETPKVYPICTIRATPSQPVHTIVWAKEFYKLLFSKNDSQAHESMLYENVEGEISTYMPMVHNIRQALHHHHPKKEEEEENNDESTTTTTTTTRLEQLTEWIAALLKALYVDEIHKQLELGRYKTALKQPTPVSWKELEQATASQAPSVSSNYRATDTSCWMSVQACASELFCIFEQAATTTTTTTTTAFPNEFDKDFDPAMRFVTAASNLRNIVFHIEPKVQSVYSAKGIAGNIIPAIATTNAIAAGLQILQVYKVLEVALEKKKKKKQPRKSVEAAEIDSRCTTTNNHNNNNNNSIAKQCRYNNILRNPTRNGLIITAVTLSKPNPSCFVCRQGFVEWIGNTKIWTLQRFIQRILQQELGLQEPSIQIGMDLIWEQGPDSDQACFEINLPKPLAQLPAGGMHHGTMIRVDDFTQALELSIHISHHQEDNNNNTWNNTNHNTNKRKEENPQQEDEGGTTTEEFPFLLKKQASSSNHAPSLAAAAATHTAPTTNQGSSSGGGGGADNDDDDDIVVLVKRDKKRKAEKNKDTNDTNMDDDHHNETANGGGGATTAADNNNNKRQKVGVDPPLPPSSSSSDHNNNNNNVICID